MEKFVFFALLVAALSLVLIHFRLFLALLLFISGFSIGFIYAIPDYATTVFQRNLDLWTKKSLSTAESHLAVESKEQPRKSLITLDEINSIPIRKTIETILDLFIRDFILFWYEPLMLTRLEIEAHFTVKLRSALNGTILNGSRILSAAFKKNSVETVTILIFNFANTLIVHLREYRLMSQQKEKKHVLNFFYSQDIFSKPYQQQKITSISALMVGKLLYSKDEKSPAVVELVKELLTCFVMDPLLQKISQPEFLNRVLIDFFSSIVAKADSATSVNMPNVEMVQQPDEKAKHEHFELYQILNSDKFNDFAGYLESLSSPAFLRFYTNVDFFRRFSSFPQPGISQNEMLNNIKQDAKAVFNMHFSSDAEFPIPLITEKTAYLLEDSYPALATETVEKVNLTIVESLKEKIENDPSTLCFDATLELVMKILEFEYLPGFIHQKDQLVDTEKFEKNKSSSTLSSNDFANSDVNTSSYEMYENRRISLSTDSLKVETPEALKHLINALSNMREQHMHVISTIEHLRQSQQITLKITNSNNPTVLPNIPKNLENYSKLNKLLKSKKNIEKEIERISTMISEIEEASTNGTVNLVGDKLPDAAIIMDLSELKVNIKDATRDPSSPFFKESEAFLNNPFASYNNRLKSTVFMIQVEKQGAKVGDSRGWIFYRTFGDFQQLDEYLKSQFAKVAKIPLPGLRKSFSLLSNDEKFEQLCVELEQYLQKLLIDQLLIESKPMQKFFRPQDIVSQQPFQQPQGISKMILAPELKKKISGILKNLPKFQLKQDESPFHSQLTPKLDQLSSPLAFPALNDEIQTDKSENNDILSNNGGSEDTNDLKSESGESGRKRPQHHDEPDRSEESFMDVDLLVEACFSLLTEAFDLHTPTQWVRRKALGAIRQLILQQSKTGYLYNYLSTNIRETIDTLVSDLFHEDTIITSLESILDRFWPPPERIWLGSRKENIPVGSNISEEKDDDKGYGEARKLLNLLLSIPKPFYQSNIFPNNNNQSNPTVASTSQLQQHPRPPSAQAFQTNKSEDGGDTSSLILLYLFRIAGRQNVINGFLRILEMLQEPEMNRVLVLNLVDILVKTILQGTERKF